MPSITHSRTLLALSGLFSMGIVRRVRGGSVSVVSQSHVPLRGHLVYSNSSKLRFVSIPILFEPHVACTVTILFSGHITNAQHLRGHSFSHLPC
ncbi:hypothetical protein QR685DRAFT_524175 [Neurospora intermedia]|uniref:Secreted protein n=1 Tax=Neurospora intermedia TaxID=5142 RepID=A0ABR3DDB5_NEUIN